MVPWFFVEYQKLIKGDPFGIATCADQVPRGQNLAKLIQNFNIVLLQEAWGGAGYILQNALKKKHNIVEKYQVWEGILGSGYFADLYNAYSLNWQRHTGGLLTAVKNNIPVIWSHHHVFKCNKGEEEMDKSANFTLLDMNNYWPQKYLLTINTHLHSPKPFGNTWERKEQKEEIKQVLIQLQASQSYPEEFDWLNCGVIFVGDFNLAYIDDTGKISDEYLDTVSWSFGVQLRDLILETDPNSQQQTYDVNNKYVGVKNDCCRMDYAFLLDEIPTNQVLRGTRKVMKLQGQAQIHVAEEREEVSDHHPIIVSIKPF